MKPLGISCLLLLLSWNQLLHAESEPVPVPDRSIYVKIVVPEKAPTEGKHPAVESWIRKDLEEKGEKEVRAVTDWISLSNPEGESTQVWNAALDGKSRGCPVSGRVHKRSRTGKVHVFLSGWTPVGPQVKTKTLTAEPGSREIVAVDLAGDDSDPEDSEVIAYAVLSVGLPKAEKE